MIDMKDPEVIESLKYLLVPKEEKIRMAAMPYSSTKNFFVPCKEEGYECAEITSEAGDSVTLQTRKNKTVTFKRDQLLQMNPPKYEKCDDMADLTFLNDATVYHNLRERYVNWYIYTYSGLFCVTINPFKRLPLYTMKMVNFYRGKKKNEVPPHLYLVADNAYAAMCRDKKNQSMLITGESGAGKTENTKKVIQYFAFVAANVGGGKKKATEEDANKPSLEDQIVSANPVLEAYGNAKTTRNNNSSRFGKFIRIHFTSIFGIAGADIESYLLEKSRITYCMELERNYHIFYQLCSKAFPDMSKEIMLEPDASKYFFINQGMLTIDRLDDAQEMKDTKTAFDVLMFTQDQQMDLFKITSAIANWGNTSWKQRPREEQAEPDGTEELATVAKLLGLDELDLIKGITKPRIKVGSEYVNKGQNKDQCTNSVGALSKAAFSRAFTWLVEIVNVTLDVKELKRAHFIGVLDIAGFETFEYNGFEQICINFTNERLQQFFNNFMFVLEQEEYKKEGIVWETQSFGADLQATIDLIEKKMGIFAILEEECIVPKATDMTFKEKLYKQHLGKHASFGKPKPKKGSKFEAHFDLTHYAGVVSYSVDGWLEKNKDPINMTVATLFKNSKGNNLLAYLFRDVGVEDGAGGGKKKGGGSQQTISSGHREQLNKLMATLDATSPHFVRCIIPNELKTGGMLDAHLVMHQLHCNGVLEGIRICRKGYPSRLLYKEFLARYGILAASRVKKAANDKAACSEVLDEIKMDTELYRIGLSKVLFKAGILGTLEELRDAVIEKLLQKLQSQMRRYLVKKNIKKMLEQKKAVTLLQKNLKAFLALKKWKWNDLMNNMKPLLQGQKKEEERLAREAEEARLAELAKEEAARQAALAAEAAAAEKAAEAAAAKERERQAALEKERLAEEAANAAKAIKNLKGEKENLESQVADLDEKLSQEESKSAKLSKEKKTLEAEIEEFKSAVASTQGQVAKEAADNKSKDNQIHKMQDEMAQQDDNIARLNKEKKRLEEVVAATNEQLCAEQDKVDNLNRAKSGLERNLDEAEENTEREKKAKAEVEKARRKVEADLKASQGQNAELEVAKNQMSQQLVEKDSQNKSLTARLDESNNQAASAARKVKDLEQQLSDSQEEASSERSVRSKVEKQRGDLKRELDEVSAQLDEAVSATNAQIEINHKRDAELASLRQTLDSANAQHEQASAQLRKKNQEAVAEIGLEMSKLQQTKNRLEKDNQSTNVQLNDAKAQIESAQKAKSNVERMAKQLEQQLQELNGKFEEANRSISQLNSQKTKFQSEANSLLSQLEDADAQVKSFTKVKQQLTAQVEEARNVAEDEARAKCSLAQQLRNLSADLDETKSQLDDESSQKNELQKQLAKASGEAQQWKAKYDVESLARDEEMEEMKRKLSVKLMEAEDQVEQAVAKVSSLEKQKQRLTGEMEDLMSEVERANSNVNSMEKKSKQFDRLVNEWRSKCESVTAELEGSQKEARQAANDIFKLKAQVEEGQDSLAALNGENKKMSDDVKDLMYQLNENSKSAHESEKTKKRLESEKGELQAALEEAERAIANSDAKVVSAQLELSNARQEIDTRLHEKEEEFESTRRNHARALESMQASLDAEVKTKTELVRQKKKLEGDITDLEVSVDHAGKANAEAHKANKKLQATIAEQASASEASEREKADLREALNMSDRRAASMAVEIDEVRAGLDQAERFRKAAESDLHDASDKISELNSANNTLNAHKRKLESDLAMSRADLDDSFVEAKLTQEVLQKALADNTRQAEEIRNEQEHSANAEKLRKNLEGQVKDLQTRLDQAEANALKGGKRFMQKLESRIIELEGELEMEQRHHQETLKEIKKNDRRLKDLTVQSDEDRKNQNRLLELNEKLQNKMKFFKRQVEETEEIAASNLGKFRKAQQELETVETAQTARALSRAHSRAPQ